MVYKVLLWTDVFWISYIIWYKFYSNNLSIVLGSKQRGYVETCELQTRFQAFSNIFKTLLAFLKACWACKMIMHIQSFTIVRLTFFSDKSHIQEHWCIFSHTHRGAAGGKRKGLPCSFWQIDFWKKGSNCVHLPFKFSIQNIVLRVSRRKSSKMFSLWGLFFCFFFDEIYIVPYFYKLGYAPTLRDYFLCKTLHLKCLTVFWIQVCLDNWSVICTLILCYVLLQSHSEF